MSTDRPFQGSLFAEDFLRESIKNLADWSAIQDTGIDELEVRKTEVYATWLNSLRDQRTRARILVRVERLARSL